MDVITLMGDIQAAAPRRFTAEAGGSLTVTLTD